MKTDTQEKTIGHQPTMQQVLEAYPAAQRALFQRYHVGGCSSAAFGRRKRWNKSANLLTT
ncbi:MAG: hypothetical protein ACI9UA_003544 [Pseudoalteromonas tetraodonis]|jgi:hypothetical protein